MNIRLERVRAGRRSRASGRSRATSGGGAGSRLGARVPIQHADIGLVRNAFVDAGYAVLVWDKPGSGDSTGEFDGEQTLTQRAEILVDAIEWLMDESTIDESRLGVWGLSQAGWVMPLALTMTDDISFMIVVSGGAEDYVQVDCAARQAR